MSDNAVVFSQVTKYIGKNKVIDSAEFTINSGRFTALLGPNGAGKTTIIRLLSGLIKADSGEITVLGKKVEYGTKECSMLRENIGVQSDSALYERLSVYENLCLWGEIYGVEKKKYEPKILELLSFFNLEHKADTKVNKLSKGMKQQVAVSRALLHEPKLLILDEPTSGLDPMIADNLLLYLNKLQKEYSVTILMCTHRLEMIDKLADYIIFLEKGKIKQKGEVGTLLQSDNEILIDIEIERGSNNAFEDILEIVKSYEYVNLIENSRTFSFQVSLKNLVEVSPLIRELSAHFNVLNASLRKKTVKELYRSVITTEGDGNE